MRSGLINVFKLRWSFSKDQPFFFILVRMGTQHETVVFHSASIIQDVTLTFSF